MNEYDPLRVELRQELQAATRAANREVAHLARRRRCNAGRSELVVRPEGAVEEQEIGSTGHVRSEEHTSELQSQSNLVCRLLLEKKTNLCRALRYYSGFDAGVERHAHN